MIPKTVSQTVRVSKPNPSISNTLDLNENPGFDAEILFY